MAKSCCFLGPEFNQCLSLILAVITGMYSDEFFPDSGFKYVNPDQTKSTYNILEMFVKAVIFNSVAVKPTNTT